MFANLITSEKPTCYFDELAECSILEDGATLDSVSISGAVIGGIIGGDAGLIAGSRDSNPVSLSLAVRVITTTSDSYHFIKDRENFKRL